MTKKQFLFLPEIVIANWSPSMCMPIFVCLCMFIVRDKDMGQPKCCLNTSYTSIVKVTQHAAYSGHMGQNIQN